MSQKKYGIKYFSILLFLFFPFLAHALPIDWQGTFGVDTTIVTNYRKVSDSSTLTAGDGSQVVGDSGSSESSFQSYLLSLKPIIIINDASTLKAEISTGYGRGGEMGENAQASDASGDGLGGALYNINTATEARQHNT